MIAIDASDDDTAYAIDSCFDAPLRYDTYATDWPYVAMPRQAYAPLAATPGRIRRRHYVCRHAYVTMLRLRHITPLLWLPRH